MFTDDLSKYSDLFDQSQKIKEGLNEQADEECQRVQAQIDELSEKKEEKQEKLCAPIHKAYGDAEHLLDDIENIQGSYSRFSTVTSIKAVNSRYLGKLKQLKKGLEDSVFKDESHSSDLMRLTSLFRESNSSLFRVPDIKPALRISLHFVGWIGFILLLALGLTVVSGAGKWVCIVLGIVFLAFEIFWILFNRRIQKKIERAKVDENQIYTYLGGIRTSLGEAYTSALSKYDSLPEFDMPIASLKKDIQSIQEKLISDIEEQTRDIRTQMSSSYWEIDICMTRLSEAYGNDASYCFDDYMDILHQNMFFDLDDLDSFSSAVRYVVNRKKDSDEARRREEEYREQHERERIEDREDKEAILSSLDRIEEAVDEAQRSLRELRFETNKQNKLLNEQNRLQREQNRLQSENNRILRSQGSRRR